MMNLVDGVVLFTFRLTKATVAVDNIVPTVDFDCRVRCPVVLEMTAGNAAVPMSIRHHSPLGTSGAPETVVVTLLPHRECNPW